MTSNNTLGPIETAIVWCLALTPILGICGVAIMNCLLGLILIFIVIDLTRHHRRIDLRERVSKLPGARLLAAFLCMHVLSCVASIVLHIPASEPALRYSGIIPKGALLVLLYALYLPRQAHFYRRAGVFVLLFLVLSGILAVNFPRYPGNRLSTNFFLRSNYEHNVIGINNYAGILATTIAGCLALFAWGKLSIPQRLALLATTLFLVIVLSMTGSRGVFLGLALAFWGLGLKSRRNRILCVALLASILLGALCTTGARLTFPLLRRSIEIRLSLYSHFPARALRHPFFGSGLRKYDRLKPSSVETLEDLHNDVLNMWIRHGPVSTFLFVWLVFSWGGTILRNSRRIGLDQPLSWVAGTAQSAFLIGLVYGLFTGAWTSQQYSCFLFFWLGVGVGPLARVARTHSESASTSIDIKSTINEALPSNGSCICSEERLLDVLALYAQCFGKSRTTAWYRWKYGLANSDGRDFSSVIELRDGQVIGHVGLTLVPVRHHGLDGLAVQVTDIMTAPEYRRKGVLSNLLTFSRATACASGASFVYSIPVDSVGSRIAHIAPVRARVERMYLNLLPLFRLRRRLGNNRVLRRLLAPFDLRRQQRLLERLAAPESISVVELVPPFSEVERLWTTLRDEHPFWIRRDANRIVSRYSKSPQGTFRVFGARREGELVGLLIIARPQSLLTEAIVADLLLASDDEPCQRALYAAALRAAREDGACALCDLAIVGTSRQRWLSKQGFLHPMGGWSLCLATIDNADEPASLLEPDDLMFLAGDFDVV